MTLLRYSIKCPKCQTTLATSWQERDDLYRSLPDNFQCPNCGASMALTEDERLTRDVSREASAPRWVAFALWPVMVFILFWGVSSLADFVRGTYWIIGGLSAVAGFGLSLAIVWVYEEIKKDKIRA